MKKKLAKALSIALALSTVMAVPANAGEVMVLNDLDGDGYINRYDAIMALQGALKDPEAAEFEATARGNEKRTNKTVKADLDDDGRISANDAAIYINQGVTVNVNIATTEDPEGKNYKVGALRSNNVLEIFEAKFANNDPDFINFFADYLGKIQGKADRATITYKGKKYSIYDSEGQQKIADEINSIKGYEGKLNATKFKDLFPTKKEDITVEYIRKFPRELTECFDESVRDNKDYAKAAAEQLRKYDTTKGDGTIYLEYEGADGQIYTETSARKVAADLVEQFGYTSLTVDDIVKQYGSHATLKYNAYTITLDVSNG